MPSSESSTATLERPDRTASGAPQTGPDLRRPDLAGRALVALAGVVAALVGPPAYVVGVLSAAALLLAVERLARSRGAGAADALLVLTGGVVVQTVLVGVVMGATPIGLSTAHWALGLCVVALLDLAVASVLPRPAPLPAGAWRTGLRAAPWVLAVVAVAAVAVGTSVRSIGPAEEPPLQMSFGRVDGTRVQVEVSASERTGPLELRTTRGGDEISYPLFTVGAGQTRTTVLTLPRDGRYTVSLGYPDQSQPLRSLVLDR